MKIPFNIQADGQDEIRDVTGFTDADLSFSSLKSSLEAAAEDVVKVIGQKTYEAIYNLYAAEPLTEEEDELDLIKKLQICIAFNGIRIYAPLKDLAFTNQGRSMRVDEHHKSAFEWQIDRHNESMESAYYKSLDRLIESLDKINPTIDGTEKWKDSDVYKNSFDVLFRTTDEFNEFFAIESRYLLMKLAPGIRKIKMEELIPRMTKDVFNQYMANLKSGTEVENEQILYQMKSACAYLSLAWAVPRMSATLFPSGIMQSYVSDRMTAQAKKVPEKSEVGVLALCFEEDGKRALNMLEELLKPPVEQDDCDPLYEIEVKPWQKFVSI